MATTPDKKPPVDWEAIERDYRAGVLSLREIAANRGVSHVAISKRAKKEGWERDLAAKIQAKAETLVNKALVNGSVNSSDPVSEREIVEATALRIAQVRSEHRQDITRMRNLVLQLLAECEAEAGNLEAFEKLGEVMFAPDEHGKDKLNELYHKVIGLPQRIKGVKELTEALKNLIALEREAYGLDVKAGEGDAASKAMGDAEVANRMAFILAQVRQRVQAGA